MLGQVATLQHKTSTQFTCAHCQRSFACIPFPVCAPRRFVLGEPPILHRFPCPSTPLRRNLRGCCDPFGDVCCGGEANNKGCVVFGKRFFKEIFQISRKPWTALEFILFGSPFPASRGVQTRPGSALHQPYPGKVALAYLQYALETGHVSLLAILDHDRIDAYRALFQLAIGFGVAGG